MILFEKKKDMNFVNDEVTTGCCVVVWPLLLH